MKSKVNVSGEEAEMQQKDFKKTWSSFKPFEIDEASKNRVMAHLRDLVHVQNGSDIDDYVLGEPTKLERYLPNLSTRSRVLFLGTGGGREVADALEQGFDAYGTTLGSRNVEYSTKVLGLPPGRVLECMNEALPFPVDHFDVVIGFQVFEHAFAPLMFLLEQRRVLRMNGTIFLEWPPAKNYTMDENPHHFICYTPGQARALLQKAGFINIEPCYDYGGKAVPVPEDRLWDGTGMFNVGTESEPREIETHLCIKGIKSHNSNWTAQ